MHFQGDAFISYAHLDNVELVEGRKGWVANLHRALEVRVAQLLGKAPHIWRDPKLAGNDLFESTIVERLSRVAILVAVVSPRYLKSEWTIRELEAFWKAAEGQGGIRVRDKARVFKVLKTPVPLDRMPPSLRGLLGYEFFRVDSETGKIRELDEVFGPEAHRDFWLLLDDLAHDICALLETLEAQEASSAAPASNGTIAPSPASTTSASPAPTPAAVPAGAAVSTGNAVYLAETSSDLREYRDVIRRDLLQHGLQVLPDCAIPLVADEATALIREQLAGCRLSIHLIGRHYGLVPEGGEQSIVELQHTLASARSDDPKFSRLLWIPSGVEVTDARQVKVIEQLRRDPRTGRGSDLLETYFEDFRTTVQEWLRKPRSIPEPAPPAVTPVASGPAKTAASIDQAEAKRVYLVADERDLALIDPWADWLFDQGVEVTRSIYGGDEREIREYHEENLVACDALVIFYGAGNEVWVRRKLREMQKAAGSGRTKGKPVIGICLIGARTPEKERFRTHEGTVIAQWDGVAPDALAPLVAAIKAGGGD